MFVILKKKHLVISVLCIALLVSVSVLTWYGMTTKTTTDETFSAKRKIPVYSVETDCSEVAISFDAAWGADKTKSILDILDKFEVRATFFLVGFWIDAYPELVKEIVLRGHVVGNHSANHPHFNTLSKDEMAKEVDLVSQKIEKLTGVKPIFFRAPFGEYSNTLMSVLEERKMVGVQWDVDSLDWKGITGKEITERVLSKVHKGSIILCHNNSEHIVDALPMILLGIKNKGLNCVGMDEIVLTDNFFVDNNGIQHSSIT